MGPKSRGVGFLKEDIDKQKELLQEEKKDSNGLTNGLSNGHSNGHTNGSIPKKE